MYKTERLVFEVILETLSVLLGRHLLCLPQEKRNGYSPKTAASVSRIVVGSVRDRVISSNKRNTSCLPPRQNDCKCTALSEGGIETQRKNVSWILLVLVRSRLTPKQKSHSCASQPRASPALASSRRLRRSEASSSREPGPCGRGHSISGGTCPCAAGASARGP